MQKNEGVEREKHILPISPREWCWRVQPQPLREVKDVHMLSLVVARLRALDKLYKIA